jgi:hypothetical protein
MVAGSRGVNRTESWVRSSRCGPKSNCVELGRCAAGVIIRDSKSAATLRTFSNAQWTAFLAHCRTVD